MVQLPVAKVVRAAQDAHTKGLVGFWRVVCRDPAAPGFMVAAGAVLWSTYAESRIALTSAEGQLPSARADDIARAARAQHLADEVMDVVAAAKALSDAGVTDGTAWNEQVVRPCLYAPNLLGKADKLIYEMQRSKALQKHEFEELTWWGGSAGWAVFDPTTVGRATLWVLKATLALSNEREDDEPGWIDRIEAGLEYLAELAKRGAESIAEGAGIAVILIGGAIAYSLARG